MSVQVVRCSPFIHRVEKEIGHGYLEFFLWFVRLPYCFLYW